MNFKFAKNISYLDEIFNPLVQQAVDNLGGRKILHLADDEVARTALGLEYDRLKKIVAANYSEANNGQ